MSFFTGHPAVRQLAKEAVTAMNERGMLEDEAGEMLDYADGDAEDALKNHADDIADTLSASLVDAIREELSTVVDYQKLWQERTKDEA